MYIIGIDPGLSGGIVALNGNDKEHIVDVANMPRGPKALYEHFLYLGLPKVPCTIFIENVHSMPTDGHKGAFTFGKGLGHIEGVLVAMGLPEPLKVNPKQWMDLFDLRKEKDEKKYDYKKRIKERILKDIPKNRAKEITLKTCDAYGIAYYGWIYIRGIFIIPMEQPYGLREYKCTVCRGMFKEPRFHLCHNVTTLDYMKTR